MGNLTLRLSASEVDDIFALAPWARSTSRDVDEQLRDALTMLIHAERMRAGGRDGLTCARTASGLRSGALLEVGPAPTAMAAPSVEVFRVHVIAVDVRGFHELVDHHGFAPGDRALVRLAKALAAQWPDRLLVRMHGDAFAAVSRTPAVANLDRSRLQTTFAEALRGAGADALDPCPSRFTIAELDLSIRRPHDPAVVGTLVAAEIERALRVERADGAGTVHVRHLDLDG